MCSRIAPAWIRFCCCSRSICFLLLASLSLPSVASSQTAPEGSIRGIVRDEQGAVLTGVTLTATSPGTPLAFTAATDSTGSYRLVSMPPGTYSVTVDLQGFAPLIRENVTVRAGLNLALDLTMKIGTVNETVRISGDSPLLESNSASHSLNISGDLQRSLPLSARRDWADSLVLAPGASSWELLPSKIQLFLVNGAADTSNAWRLDGADLTAASQSASSYVNFNPDVIDDVQITTSGTDATAPPGLGAIVNITTRSGTNVFQGRAGLTYQNRHWNSTNVVGGSSVSSESLQPEASLGGPLLRDRLWFFAAYRHLDTTSAVGRTGTQLAALRALVPNFATADNNNEAHLPFIKLTAGLSRGHTLNGFYQYDRNPTDQFDSYSAEPSRTVFGGHAGGLNLTSIWSRSMLTRVSLSFNNKGYQLTTPTDEPQRLVWSTAISDGAQTVGSGLVAVLGSSYTAAVLQPASKVTLAADTSFAAISFVGTHELRVGFYAQPLLKTQTMLDYVANGVALEEYVLRNSSDYASGLSLFHRTTYDRSSLETARQHASDYAVYVQDAWRPHERLTLDIGLRAERVRRRDELFALSVEDSVAIGPRIGANYSLTADRRRIVTAGYSRIHDLPSQTAVSLGQSAAGRIDAYDVTGTGLLTAKYETPASSKLNPNRVIDPNDWNQPYVNDFNVGYQQQLPWRMVFAATAINREYRDRVAYVDVNSIFEGTQFVGYRNQNQNAILQVTNNKWNWPIYRSVTLSLTEQHRAIQLLATYTRQWRHLAGTWQPADPASFIQPSAFGNDRGIGTSHGSSDDANSYNSPNSSNNIAGRDHVVRLGTSTSALPFGLIAAVNYTFQSGTWSGPILTRVSQADPQYGPATLTLANGRLVKNPLATQLRFAYNVRGDKQFTTDALNVVNLRLGKALRFGAARVDVFGDVFNLFNGGSNQLVSLNGTQLFSTTFGRTDTPQSPRAAQVAVNIKWGS
jgi:hypothetical protein